MLFRYLIFLSFLFFLACSSDGAKDSKANVPKIEDSVWVDVLTQLYISEAFKNKRSVAGKDISKEVVWLDSVILAEHNLTKVQFEKAYTELGKDMKKIEKIFDEVLESLSKMESEIKSDSVKTYSLPLRLK